MEEYGICGLVLMENAGRGVADTLCRLGIAGPVVIACGKGNNAGDGFVIARHLDLRGYEVRLLLWADPAELSGDAAVNYQIVARTGISQARGDSAAIGSQVDAWLAEAGWIVDALLGTGAQGEPRAPLDAAIQKINASPVATLAVDLPSGLDCDTGAAASNTIVATHTCTFVAPKPGFFAPGADRYTGRVHVLDIGAPRQLVEEMLRQET